MSKPSIDVLLENEVTVITGGRGVGKTALLLEAAAENSDQCNTSLVVLRDMPANEFYDKMMNLKTKYDVSNVAVVKIQDFDGDFSGLTKDASTFDRVFFEGIYSLDEFLTLPSFVEVFTFETVMDPNETHATSVDEDEDWANFCGVYVTESGKEVVDNGR